MQEKSATSKLSSLDPNQFRRRVMLGFAIFYTIVILSTSNLANAQIMYSDNSVDADSNIDSINNIGQSIGGDYENAKSLDGSYQQLQEGNSSEIAYIEDYIDQQSDVDSYPSSGSTTNFTSLQSTDSASAQLTEGNKRVSWGDPTQQELETTIDWVRCMAGDFNLGANYQVSEIYLSSNTTNGGGQARLSVYQGGTLNDPAGATLIWDAGTVDAAEGFVGVTGGSAPLNNNQPIWVCVKSNDNTFNVYYNTSNDVESDFQSGTGRIMLGAAHSTDETVPFESTIDSTGATFAAFWYSFYIILEDTTSDRQLDQEYQFTSVIDYLPNETLSIKTGSFSGTEDINVTYWSGSNWAIITTDLNPNSWNNFSVLLISPKFTIKLGGSNTNSDTIIDTWNIDAILLVVSGTGDQEVAATALSNVDNSPDIGVIDNFN
ncbi:MAG: hypothetical protein ACC656_09830, partial [Candidatus Heimdallarchaeota archaeon]